MHHEHVRPTDVLVDTDEHFTVGEARTGHLTQLGAEHLRHLFGERLIGRSRKDLEAARRRGRYVQRRSHPVVSACVKGVGTEPVEMGRSVAGTSCEARRLRPGSATKHSRRAAGERVATAQFVGIVVTGS